MKKFTPKEIQAKLGRLKGARGTWENHWQEVLDHVNTRKNTVLSKKSPGQKRTWMLLDNTGMHANETLAGALHGMLTNPDQPWFELTTGDLMLDSSDEVRPWLQGVTRQMHNILNNSNFQTEVHEMYIDLVSVGTANMEMVDDEDSVVRFSTKFIADYWIKENKEGQVDELFREWKWTAAQLVATFGEQNLHEDIKKAFKDGKDEKFCVIHYVYPRILTGDMSKKAAKYCSQYVIPEKNFEIKTKYDTYTTFPYLVPRWTKAAGEEYGRSPGMLALPELKVLNKMNETMLIGAQKLVDPPLVLPDDGYILPLMTQPGGLNYKRPGADRPEPLFSNSVHLEFGYQGMEDRRKRVRDAYYIDQLRLQQGGPMMTATEVLQRTEEAMRLLGPMLGRMQVEFLRPLIDRLYDIMDKRGMIPLPPEEIQGSRIEVKYSSLMAKSQRVNEGQSLLRLVQASAPFLQMDGGATAIFDSEEIIRFLAYTYGVPHEALRTRKDMEAMRQAQAQAQQAAAQAAQQQNAVDNSLVMAKAAKEAQGIGV